MVQLVPMTPEEFEPYLTQAIADFAEDNLRAGYSHPSEALQRSEQEFRNLLPEGVATPDQHLYSIKDAESGESVGMIWLQVRDRGPVRRAFIYDFRIADAKQGRGYGTQAMQAIEEQARSLGAQVIALHVFAHNTAARHLYEKVGYEVASLNMQKELT